MSDRKIEISGQATKAYSDRVRAWADWPNAAVKFADVDHPMTSLAVCDPTTQTITANPERLLLNPHGLLRSLTPFRMRQEAVLTGALMHEAAHARFTKWKPTTKEGFENWKHLDGEPVTMAQFRLATTLDEPRVEGLMRAEVDHGRIPLSDGLGWTMEACAAYILPPTKISTDPHQAILDVLTSYILRSGRQIAWHANSAPATSPWPKWVQRQRVFTNDALLDHFTRLEAQGVTISSDDDPFATPTSATSGVIHLVDAAMVLPGTNPDLVGDARKILALLFPETPEDQMPQAQATLCAAGGTDPEGDEGSEDEQGGGDEQGSDEEGEDTPGMGAEELADIERQIKESISEDTAGEAAKVAATAGGEASRPEGYRAPTANERGTQRAAERFLRDLVDPTQGAKEHLSETPSSQVDGAAMSAWKAAGRTKTPHFFRRTQREVEPAPPVKIAVLVDVSYSMNILVQPSAVLSWALSSAAHDLRNFAGRGQQIQSCLVHWGSFVTPIQAPGQVMPGIHDTRCNQGTHVMNQALDWVNTEAIPGFLDPSPTPENRLLVQFTDWELSRMGIEAAQEPLARAAQAGVKMLSILPTMSVGLRRTAETSAGFAPGQTAAVVYDPAQPDEVWQAAAKMLRA